MRDPKISRNKWDLQTIIFAPLVGAALTAAFAVPFYLDERKTRMEAERQLERYSSQEYEVAINENWDLVLDARHDALNPASVTLTPVFDTPLSQGLKPAIGQPHKYDYDQIKVTDSDEFQTKQAILPRVREDMCARPGNIDRCDNENIRTVRVRIDFFTGDGLDEELPAPS